MQILEKGDFKMEISSAAQTEMTDIQCLIVAMLNQGENFGPARRSELSGQQAWALVTIMVTFPDSGLADWTLAYIERELNIEEFLEPMARIAQEGASPEWKRKVVSYIALNSVDRTCSRKVTILGLRLQESLA